MDTQKQIENYINGLPGPKRADIQGLHARMLQLLPKCRLWFLDGRDDTGKIFSNPQIGYGQQTLHHANGRTKEFYQIGISGNKTGISVYILGLEDKGYLPETYGKTMGKAHVTGYCIKFKTVGDIHRDTLESAILDGVGRTG